MQRSPGLFGNRYSSPFMINCSTRLDGRGHSFPGVSFSYSSSNNSFFFLPFSDFSFFLFENTSMPCDRKIPWTDIRCVFLAREFQ